MQVEVVFTFTDFGFDLNDFIVFTCAVLYAVMVLFLADLAKKRTNMGPEFTRRIVHLFAGGAIWSVPYYTHPWVATLVALLFVLMLGLANQDRFSRFFSAMARPEDLDNNSVRGPFWYAVSITLLTVLFTFTGNYLLYFLAGASIHIMMFGDGMSAPVGIKYGQNHSRLVFGSKRSIQGSLALLIFGFLGALVGLWFFGVFNQSVIPLGIEIVVIALIGGISAALIELISPKGTDNITVPLLTCVIMFLVSIAFGLVTLPL